MNQLSEVMTFAQPKKKNLPLSLSTQWTAPHEGSSPLPPEQVFRNIFGKVPLGMYQTDLSGTLLNRHQPPAADSPEADVGDACLTGFIHPQERKALSASWRHAMESGRSWSERFAYRCADGRVFWLQALIAELHDGSGQLIGYQGCNLDVTVEVAAQQSLSLSEDRHRAAIEAANAGIWDLDVAGGRCYFSPFCFELLGYRQAEASPRIEDWTNILHPEYLDAVRRVRDDCIDGVAQKFELELRLKTNEGKWRWFRCKGKAVGRDGSGKAIRLIGTLIDVNEAKMMEHLLRMEHDLLNLITSTSPVGIMFIEPDGNVAFANPRAERILGLSKQEIASRRDSSPVRCMIAQGYGSGSEETTLFELLRTGDTLVNACFAFTRPDGSVTLLSASTSPFLDMQSKVSGTVVTLEDVTEQKRREQVMADNDRLMRETQRIAQLGSYVLDLAKDRWNCSSKLEEILGMDETFSKTLRGHIQVVHGEFQETFVLNYMAAVTHGRPFEMEYKIRRHCDKAERWVTESCELIRDAASGQMRLIGTIKDVTETREAEEAIRRLNDELDRRVMERTSQLAAAKKEIESFSYSVSHDLRAPLRHINSYSAILIEEHGDALPNDARQYLDRICTASSRLGRQIDDLLTLTRVGRTEMKRQSFSISAMAAEVADMLRETRSPCGTQFLVQQGLNAYGDSDLVRLVLQNLMGNSVKYASRVAAPTVQFGQATVHGRHAFFVRDKGVGFDMAYVEKLFQPFQRLHGSEFEGTGIGLATVWRIVERHGGSIWAEGEEDRGATFYFTLPRRAKPGHNADPETAG